MTNTNSTDPADRAANESLGSLLGQVTRDLSTLMRQEVELAKAELKDSATKAGKGAGAYAGAGVAGHFALLFLSLAAWWGLGDLIDNLGWAGVIVAIIYAIVALVLYSIGKREMKTVRGLPQTAETVKKIPEALKPEETR